MAVKTSIGSTGVVQSDGSGLEVIADTSNVGVSPYRLPVNALSANTTLSVPGAYTITSSTGGAKTVTLPLAANSAGGIFVFRSLSNDTHVITCSQETAGVKALCAMTGSGYANQGTIQSLSGSGFNMLASTSGAGVSAVFICDGANFCLIGGSGSFTFTGI